jgi:hypothetical protein
LAKVTLRKETPLIQIIDRPILPLAKERFGKAKGIVLGFSWVFCSHWVDNKKSLKLLDL